MTAAADRAKAAEVLGWNSADVACAERYNPAEVNLLDRIAAALAAARAEERARWEAKVRGLAAMFSDLAKSTEASVAHFADGEYRADQLGLAMGYRRAAARLRGLTDNSEEE